jgi:hypothetical protein
MKNLYSIPRLQRSGILNNTSPGLVAQAITFRALGAYRPHRLFQFGIPNLLFLLPAKII